MKFSRKSQTKCNKTVPSKHSHDKTVIVYDDMDDMDDMDTEVEVNEVKILL